MGRTSRRAAIAASAALAVFPAGATASVRATSMQLALMPLPPAALGPAGASLPVESDSGPVTNAAAATAATGNVTAAQLAKLGRISGYELHYSDRTGKAYEAGHGLLAVDMRVDSYRDRRAAAAGFAFTRSDELLVRTFASPLLAVDVTQFPAGAIGDAAYGLAGRVEPRGTPAAYQAEVLFASGSLVAQLSLSAVSQAGLQARARSLAAKLEARIAGVLSGSVRGDPVPVPPKAKAGPPAHGPDPAKLALTPADLGAGTVTHQAYTTDTEFDPVSEYDREIQPAGPFGYLDAEVAVYPTPLVARFAAGFTAGGFASQGAMLLVIGPTIGGSRVSSSSLRLVALRAAVGAHASVLTVRVASGTTYEFTFAAVRAGRTVEVLSMVAAPGAVSAQELQKVAAAADARLRGRPQPPSA